MEQTAATGTVIGTNQASQEEAATSQSVQKPDPTTPQETRIDVTKTTEYLGLQRVVSQREKQISDLTEQLATVSAQYEELKLQHNSANTVKTDLAKTVEELQSKVTTLESEKNQLSTTVERTQLLATKYPQLLKMAKYIPQAATLEEYEQEVQNFAAAINVEATGISEAQLAGSGIVGSADTKVTKQQEKDTLWEKLNQLAGQPGKEQEYDTLYARWLEIQDS